MRLLVFFTKGWSIPGDVFIWGSEKRRMCFFGEYILDMSKYYLKYVRVYIKENNGMEYSNAIVPKAISTALVLAAVRTATSSHEIVRRILDVMNETGGQPKSITIFWKEVD